MSIQIYLIYYISLCRAINSIISCKKILSDYNYRSIYLIDTLEMTPQSQYNKNIPNNVKDHSQESQSSVVDTKTLEIVQAFKVSKDTTDSSYFSVKSKHNVVSDFRAYVTEHYGSWILTTLQKEWKLDQAFNDIADRGFVLSDFFNSDKKETIRQQLGSTTSESQAISQSCMTCYHQWSQLNEESKKKLPFDEFIGDLWYDVKRDDHDHIISIALKKNSKVKSISQLDTSRKEFVRSKTDNNELIKIWDNCMDVSHFDPIEKIVCITTVRSLYDRIQKLDGKKRIQSNELLEDIFGKNINTNTSVSALTSWTNFIWLERQLEDFFSQLWSLWLTDKEIEWLKSLSIDPEKCLKYGEQSKELLPWTVQKSHQAKKFSELDKKVQWICDRLVTTNIINRVDQVIDSVESDLTKIGTIFNMPGSMKGFFEQFTPDLWSLSKTDRQEYQDLKNQESSYRDNIEQANGEEKEKLVSEWEAIKKQISDFNHDVFWDSTSQYFKSIGEQVTQSNTIVWRPNDHLWWQLSQVLQKLYDHWRDMAILSESEQNICMRSSVAMQLAKVKQQWWVDALWYNFEQYADFVSELFDFTSKKSILQTKDGQSIDLNFTKKSFVGKPDVGTIIDITQGFKWLENLHVEFELDINNNPDAADFLKMITGGNSSQLFQKITDQTGREQQITESTQVEMIGSDGQRYEGYLSPALLEDMTVSDDDQPAWYDSSHSFYNNSNTFVLYSKPVDQLHDDREVKIKKWSNLEGKGEPIFINPSNTKDWKINILDHKVTLNDAKINTLSLGHIMAQEYDKQQLLLQDITTAQDGTIWAELNKFRDWNFQDIDKNPSASESVWQQSIEDTVTNKDWNAMFPDNNKEWKEPEVGMRFALQVDKVVSTSIWADDPKLLSATIKKVHPDGSITFWFDSLTRPGDCYLKDVTLSRSQLSVFKGKDVFKNITYLWTDEDSKKSYPELLTHLAGTFDNKKYNFWMFSGLDLKDGKFMKGNEPVSFIIPVGETNKKYYVEYTLEKAGDKYRIKSTWYDATVTGEDWKPKDIQTHFDLTTDLSGILLVLAGKNIAPYTPTEKESIQRQERWNDLPTTPKKIRSLSTIRSVLKWWTKSVMDGLKKKRWENQEDEVKYLLFTEMNLYRKMSNWPLGQILEKFDLDIFDDLADDAESSAMDYNRKKIEWYLSHFKKFNLVYNAPNGIFGLLEIKKIVKWATDSYPNCSLKQRHKVAAVLLHMLDKMKSGYAKDFAEFPRGTYVKLLMWPVAYTSFLEKYKALEQESKKWNDDKSKKKLEALTMLEYNFIVENTRGWANMDADRVRAQWGKAFYFQNIYGREYANQLGNAAGKVKEISWDKNSEDVKKHISSNNFDFIAKECQAHIGDMRWADAVSELIALQHLASSKQESDQVFLLMMAGMLNGLFIHHLGKDTKEQLKGSFRNSSIPFPQWIEHHDAQHKIQTILNLATANLETPFDKFTYKWEEWKTKSYSISDFDALHVNKDDLKWSVEWFMNWTKWASSQIIPFLHMDPSSMNTEDNLVKIRKSDDPELKIFGKKVSPEAKKYVGEIMWELYYNRDRWANIDNYNAYSEFSHTATTIENFYVRTVNKYNWPSREPWVWDHADQIRSQLDTNAPTGKITPWREYKLAHDVNEFFRTFRWIGNIRYDTNTISEFYRYLRLAQQKKNDPDYSSEDIKRLIWFKMTDNLYGKGPVPNVVANTFTKYMNYFEENLDAFTSEVGRLHEQPDTQWTKNFLMFFEEPLSDLQYVPSKKWSSMNIKERSAFVTECRNWVDPQECLNDTMKRTNDSKAGVWSRNYNNNSINMSIDKARKMLRWNMNPNDDTQAHTVTSQIRAKNNNEVDWNSIKESNAQKPVANDYHKIMNKIDPRHMTPEQREEEKKIEEFRLLQERYGMWWYEDAA